MREKGYTKAVAYYWADNIPAVWNTRVLNKFKELEELRVYGLWSFNLVFRSRPHKKPGSEGKKIFPHEAL